ncbi:MAG: hypothetical protein ACQ9ET_04985 [Nitrosomonadaceae bacterium]
MTDKESQISNGTCEFCKTHDKLSKLEPDYVEKLANKLRKKQGYQVLIGVSGGLDSSYMLWYTVNVLGLKPLVVHFNNGWNDPIATDNIRLLVDKLRVDYVEFSADEEYDELCGAFLLSGVRDLDIPNDIYMTEIFRKVQLKYGIKYGFNGHDFRTEGSTPLAWTYMDAKYIKSVYRNYTLKELKTPYLYTFWRQIYGALRGLRQIRVFHYIKIDDFEKKATMLDFGWKDYGVKHGENIYTKFLGYYVLPKRFGIDKRKVYLSAQVRSGMPKGVAKYELKQGVDIEVPDLSRTGVTLSRLMNAKKHTYQDFGHYNFKRWKWLLWILVKLNLTSYNFYKKYT